jgi:O-antigen ligase
MFGGVTTQKNSLGETVFVFSIMILWDLIEIYKEKNRKGKKLQMGIRVAMLLLGLWLLKTCDSQTSMLCLIIGTSILWGTQRLLQMKKGRRVLIIILTSIVCLVVLDKVLGLSEIVIRALGRDPNLTGRTDIWKLVLDQKTDPLRGEGFYVFWDSPKGKAVIESFMQVNSAHNGYLDLYMDGGVVGVSLLVVTLLLAGRRAIDRLFSGDPLGKVGLAFWFLPILYNFSESSFFRLDVLWFSFLLLCVVCPLTRRQKLHQQKLEEARLNAAGYA